MLSDEWEHNPLIDFYKMDVLNNRGEIVLKYKLVKGVSESSFAIACAKKAHLPTQILEKADVVSVEFNATMKPAKDKLKKLASEVPVEALDLMRKIYSTILDDTMNDEEKSASLQELQPLALHIATNE